MLIFHQASRLERNSLQVLQQRLLRLCFFNLFIVAIAGILLRSAAIMSLGFDYKFMVHAHSHFAFGGWLLPMMQWLIMRYFPAPAEEMGYAHWRNIICISILSAYGMLFSFPFQGYAAVSIFFSTLSVAGGFYLAWAFWKATNQHKQNIAIRYIRTALIYFVISAAGAFATGPLMAMGMKGSVWYYDAIYFYLHFQYNGFFVFMVLGLLYQMLGNSRQTNANTIYLLFNISCLPAYALSTLWSEPGLVYNIIGGMAATLQLAALFYLGKDLKLLRQQVSPLVKVVIMVAFGAFAFKSILQLASAFPFIADMAYSFRNFIIAYLHLVLLGFVSMFVFGAVLQDQPQWTHPPFRKALSLFATGFVFTESLLVVQALGEMTGFAVPAFKETILAGSLLFAVATFRMFQIVAPLERVEGIKPVRI